MDDHREGVNGLAVERNVQANQIALLVSAVLVVEAGIPPADAFQPIIIIYQDFRQWHIVLQHGTILRDVFHLYVLTPTFLVKFHNCTDIAGRSDRFDTHNRLADVVDPDRIRVVRGIVHHQHVAALEVDVILDVGHRGDEV